MTTTNTTLTIKTEKRTRDEAKKVAERLGVPLTTVVNMMLKRFIREQSITLSAHPIPLPEKIAEWDRMSDEMDAHPEKYPIYESTDELFAHWDELRSPRKAKASNKSVRRT